MKTPKPTIPNDAPPGTVWFGRPIEWFRISFGITGESLVPDEISKLMGCEPDESQQKGKPILRADGTVMRTAHSGAWRLILEPEDTDVWDCSKAMMLVLQKLPSAVRLWRRTTKQYQAAFFVGLCMTAKNKGFELSPEVMRYLGARGIAAGFDVYYDGEGNAEPEARPNGDPAAPVNNSIVLGGPPSAS